MKINNAQAAQILREEALRPATDPFDQEWVRKIDELSQLCAMKGGALTHITFLGAAILAKATDIRADLFAVKPNHAKNNPHAFSIRPLAHGVLVPSAAEFGISLGVTGREPLNNQPYFRMKHLDDGTPVAAGSKAGFDYMVQLVRELNAMKDSTQARAALRAFIAVRRRYLTSYADHDSRKSITPDKLLTAITGLVREESEGGRRAQAVVAGLMDVFAGSDRVESGKINDPSRKYPGDVCVRSASDPDLLEKAIEVRDKPVSASDVMVFGKKCLEMGVQEACLVMVSARQVQLNTVELTQWANEFKIGLTLFHGWNDFVEQALFWSPQPKLSAATDALGFIHERLIGVDVSPAAIELWAHLTRKN